MFDRNLSKDLKQQKSFKVTNRIALGQKRKTLGILDTFLDPTQTKKLKHTSPL